MNDFLLKYAILSLKREPTRTKMALLAVILSSFLMFTVLSVGNGLAEGIKSELAKLGNDKVIIYPVEESKMYSSFSLLQLKRLFSKRDVLRVNSISGVVRAVGFVFGRARVKFGRQESDITVYAMDPSGFDMWSSYLKFEAGRKFHHGHEAVVGNDVANKIFPKKIRVGNKIRINNITFRVVGVLEKIGASYSTSDDQQISVPMDVAHEIFPYIPKDRVQGIMVQIVPEMEGQVVSKLKRMFKDTTIITPEFIQRRAGKILSITHSFSLILGLISVVMSSLGVANALMASIYERKKEFATLRAIGMKGDDVVLTALYEGVLLTGAGGILGILLSLPFSLLLPYRISLFDFFLVLLFSLLPGIVGAYIPARKISALRIVDGLRE
jgi:putative ABC transport system permease protein